MANRKEMSKTYDPRQVEERLYNWWEEQGYFIPRKDESKPPFVIVIPPPNITGELHHGHAMFITFEDLLIRWHRMLGDPSLWLPGTDHAGIATQNVVEKSLAKQGKTRQQIGREEFVKLVWDWRAEYGSMITRQLRRLGGSVDWTRERFTMDAQLSRAVREAFVRLFDKGLIYRGPRLVNWCPRCETAISDLEVEHEETEGKLYYIKYPLEGLEGEYVMVATTRPETMLGDTAVAVHPQDRRYKKIIGRTAILPELGRRIPILGDDVVDRKFGTGAVKVTPAHDQTDYEIGQRHNLPMINIMNRDATLNAEAGPYQGLDRYVARDQLLKDLERDGLLVKVEPHMLSIGHCQRCDTVVEPLISTQWFVKTKPLADAGIEAVRDGRIQIVPERFNKIYFQWMENIRDWCISRQLWWGHRIPVWYCENDHMTCTREDPTACAVCGSTNLRQDEDVLDTWFSSALWPFSTLGWPENTDDLRRFYPTSVLETGYDILFFWVARMIMAGLEFTGQPPFHTVYLHGLMRHVDGSKMSKSDFRPGDNPLDVIADYSADALRFFIVTSSSPGADVRMNLDKVADARNFANKIWNAARFVIGNLGEEGPGASEGEREKPKENKQNEVGREQNESAYALADRWILSRLNTVIAQVTQLLKDFRFNDAGQEIYHFIWDEFCDWYLEACKVTLYGSDDKAKETTRRVLVHTLDRALRLLHPMMPFVTEEVYQHLRGKDWPRALIAAQWPEGEATEPGAEAEFALIMETVRTIRNTRSEYGIEPARRIPARIETGPHQEMFEAQRAVLASLARLDADHLEIATQLAPPAQAIALHLGPTTTYLPLAGLIDLDKEKARLAGEIESAMKAIARSEGLLAGDFANKAPAALVSKEREKLEATRLKVTQFETRIQQLQALSAPTQLEPEAAKPGYAAPKPAIVTATAEPVLALPALPAKLALSAPAPRPALPAAQPPPLSLPEPRRRKSTATMSAPSTARKKPARAVKPGGKVTKRAAAKKPARSSTKKKARPVAKRGSTAKSKKR